MNPTPKPRPRAIAVRRALMNYLRDALKAATTVDELSENVKALQVLAAQFDELDAKIWGDK